MSFAPQLSLYAVFASIFATYAYLAFLRAQENAQARVWPSLLLVGVAAWISWKALVNPPGGSGGAVLAFVWFLVILPTLFLGSAWFLGTAVACLRRWKRRLGYLMVPVLVLPFALSVFLLLKNYQAEQTRLSQVAEFQQQQLEADFGAHKIGFPVTPQVAIRYRCWRAGSVRETRCTNSFFRSEGLQNLGAGRAGPIGLFEMDIWQVHPMCKADDLKTMHECSTATSLADWCDARRDRPSAVWCGQIESDRIFLILESQRKKAFAGRLGVVIDTSGIPQELRSGGLEIKCWDDRSWGPACQADFEIARDITAHLMLKGADESDVISRVIKTRRHAENLWRDMLAGAN